jgi:predicted N-acetyltransferase YhbS
MNKFKVARAQEKHIDGMEKIHLSYFSEIGQGVGSIRDEFGQKDKLSLVALDSDSNVIGYLVSTTYGTHNYFEWFGVSEKRKGIAQALFQEYEKELKLLNVIESSLSTRNRFKDAIIFYLKSGYSIKGLTQGSDGDLMIQFRKLI